MRRLLVFSATVLLLTGYATVASADHGTVRVAGAGTGVITDPDDNEFSRNLFAIAGEVRANGSARGRVEFALGEPFSAVWGALPGVDLIRLKGEITSGTVAADGTVTLRGQLTETDYSDGDVVFVEKDVPFEIVIAPGGREFVLTWCLLPGFHVGITDGKLQVK